MRTRCTVTSVAASTMHVAGHRPYRFLEPASILVWVTRTFTDGRVQHALLHIVIGIGYITDGASTFWPVSLLVPPWRDDDRYNAGPVAHDVLYLLEGTIPSTHEPVMLSREEVDDILRGIWRCWGMSRFLAGCADKAIEAFAGGKSHWGSDQYGVRGLVSLDWEVLDDNG